jgi:Uma2 family endonuclease
MTTLQSTPLPAPSKPRLRLWSVQEYHRMAYPILFGPDEHLELINGEIVFRGTDTPRPFTDREQDLLSEMGLLQFEDQVPSVQGEGTPPMSPMGRPHAVAVIKTDDALRETFGNGYVVWCQSPANLSGFSELEPDVFVAIGQPDHYLDHPPNAQEAVLVVEVSDSTLRQDRDAKARLYATVGVSDYWIVDLQHRTLEVRREPQGGNYASVTIYSEDQAVAPLAAPEKPVRVSRLLPLARPHQHEPSEGTLNA